MGSEFRIFGGVERLLVLTLVLVDEPGFRRVRSSVFPYLDLGLSHFLPNIFLSSGFLDGFKLQRTVLVDEPGLE